MIFRITPSGHIYTDRLDNCEVLINFIIASGYSEEFCVSTDFSPDYCARLMKAGFLVMSALIEENEKKQYILLPKHHNLRSVLFFEDLHISKTVKRLLGNYELKADKDFNTIVKNCVKKHGDDWLTPPLLEVISKIRENSNSLVRPFSFALYREGKLKAGEFGIIAGNVYTSYSGYYDEDSAGRVQMILAAQYLRDNGFSFWDLGMPLEYKYSLGVRDLDTKKFIQKFRQSV